MCLGILKRYENMVYRYTFCMAQTKKSNCRPTEDKI